MTKMFDVRNSDAFRRLREAEKVATSIFYNAAIWVPGVLQVPAFAKEIICGLSGLPADDPEAVERIEERTARRIALLDRLEGADAPRVHVVIDEIALRRRMGEDALRQQVEHLIEISRKPTVHLGVMSGIHPGSAGQFEVYDSAHDSLVFFEDAEGDRILDHDADRIALYRTLISTSMDSALTGEAARTFLGKLIDG